MSSEDVTNEKSNKSQYQLEMTLHRALLLAEVGINLKEKYISGEKYVYNLRNMMDTVIKSISVLHIISKSSFEEAQHLLKSLDNINIPSNVKSDCEKLFAVIQKQLTDLELRNIEGNIENLDLMQISEKIKYLESKQKNSENLLIPSTSSTKSVKADIDEKYPENLSRESLIDLNTVNLPPVPEDIFTSFSSKPMRSSSLSSLKSMRKIKLHLQKAESSDDEESSENEDNDYSKIVFGDTDDRASSPHSPVLKKLLGNIKEESQD